MIVVLIGFCLLQMCAAFLLEDNCPAPSPCTCSSSSIINCDSKSLTVVPEFALSDNHVATLTVNLNYNRLQSIPAYAFKNLSSINATYINLHLQSNHIGQFDNDAFASLGNSTVRLYLNDNNLTSIPVALTKIKRLIYLDIRDNPIRSADSFVLGTVGSSLETLLIDLSQFTQWPRGFRYLNQLKDLQVSRIPFSHLESDIFHGFENSLTSLTFDYSNLLQKIPFAVCNLQKLQSLTMNHFSLLQENRSSIFEHCKGRHLTVTSVTLQNDNLHSFPNVFEIFPSLTSLDMQSNSLELIEWEKIPNHNTLLEIDLRSNQFKRIPPAFHKLKLLTRIVLMRNEIISVEDFDLNVLKHLTHLYLDGNPLRYISPNAFRGNPSLHTLYLQYTKLITIPTAVLSLSMLTYLNVYYSPIECSCDMSYLNHWNITSSLTIYGDCKSFKMSVQDYVTTSLKLCP